MAVYVALLRGVNVGGNMLKMERLRHIFAEMGVRRAETFIQSGNVVFEAGKLPKDWCGQFEQRLAGKTRLGASVILRTASAMSNLVLENPFLQEEGVDEKKLHVTFLAGGVTPQGLTKLKSIPAGNDRFTISGRELYVYCPGGYGRTKLSNMAMERALQMKATTRNWNTVKTLTEMAAAMAGGGKEMRADMAAPAVKAGR